LQLPSFTNQHEGATASGLEIGGGIREDIIITINAQGDVFWEDKNLI